MFSSSMNVLKPVVNAEGSTTIYNVLEKTVYSYHLRLRHKYALRHAFNL